MIIVANFIFSIIFRFSDKIDMFAMIYHYMGYSKTTIDRSIC